MVRSRTTPKFSTTTRSTVSGTNIQQQKSTATQLRLQQRQERVLRRAEDRQLRHLPASQRAAHRLEIQNARQLRAQQKLQIQSGAATQIKSSTATQTQVPKLRRSGKDRVTTQAALKGRFSAPFAATGTNARHRHGDHIAAHRAWRRGHRAGFVAWYGPVFWPYAYSDIFDYTFWPYGYDDGYFAYAYDDFFDGVFWGQAGPPEDYAYTPAAPRASYAGVQELCKQPGTGITAWPFAEIERKVGLNDEQKALLGDVRRSASDAAATFKASCPAESLFPLTPR
jgi:hypothetical protein